MTITLTAQTTTVKLFTRLRERESQSLLCMAKDLKKWNGKRFLVKTETNTGTIAQACMEASSNNVN